MKTFSKLVECLVYKAGVFLWTFNWRRVGVSQKGIPREKLTCQNRGGGGVEEEWKNIAFSQYSNQCFYQYSTQLSNFYDWSDSRVSLLNPLSRNIQIQILQTDLHTSPLRISWENLIKDHGIFSMMIILLILITLSLDSVWILLGENCCWSLLGLTGLTYEIGSRILPAIMH